MRKKTFIIFFLATTIFSFYFFSLYVDAALSCTVTTTCNSPAVVVGRISATTNAHAETAAQSNYANLLCCSGIATLGNSCSGNFLTVLKLSAATNAHVEQNTQSNYGTSICLSDSTVSNTLALGYQASNCTGYDTTIASMSATTNAQVGDSSAYTTKVCASDTSVTLTFSNDDATIGFGTLSPSSVTYANSAATGSLTLVTAHTLSISTTSTSGYTLTYIGPTLTNQYSNTIAVATAIGTGGSSGTSQFAMSGVLTGTGAMATNYDRATPKWTYVANATTTLASASGAVAGDSIAMSYEANISTSQASGQYGTDITYVVTGNF